MKKYLSRIAVLSIVFALCLSGCSGKDKKSSGSNPNIGLLDENVFKVGMEIGYPPFEMFDDNNNPIGHDVELAAEIAKIMGVAVEYEDTAWDGIFSGLSIDKYDAVISAVTITASRRQEMDFSTPYIENWQSIAVRAGAPPVKSPEGMNGLIVGYQDATTSAEWLEELIETGVVSCETSAYDKVLNAFDDLRLGRVDCVLSDSVVAEGYIDREPDNFEISWHQKKESTAEPELFGIAVKKGNQALLKAINEALAELIKNGTLSKIQREWLS